MYAGEFAQLKVKVLMMTSQASFGEGMGGGGGGGAAAPRASEPYDEAAALRESLRVSHDGGMPDVSAVVVRVAQVRERKLPGGIGAPRGVEVEYATDLFIQAPGEELMVARSWRSFREFRQLLMSIGSEIQPSQTLGRPTLPSKEKDLCVLSTHLLEHPSSHWSLWRSERSELQIKMENLVRLMLHNTPASHRLPLEKFLCLDQ